jgi:uncharacterized protein (TIGR03435 family)
MHSGTFCAGLLALTVSASMAQQPGPSFDVASVKPAAPIVGGRMMVRMQGGPGSPDPGQITYTNVALKNVLTIAYNVRSYQISGPSWLDSERFDIMAKIPKDTSKEDFQLMLQNLLAERFKLKLHRESKDMPIYALVVGKNGVKMKETPKEEKPAQDMAGAPNANTFAGPPEIKTGKDGMPVMPRGGMGGRGGMIMMGMGGKMKLAGSKQQVTAIAEMLSNQLGRPVVDQTGLTANYDYELEFAPDESTRMPGMMGAMPPPPPDGGGAGAPSAPEGSGPSLMTALQEQLGLKLESKKGPVALLVVDSMEKVPTEN